MGVHIVTSEKKMTAAPFSGAAVWQVIVAGLRLEPSG